MTEEELLALATGPDFEREPEPFERAVERAAAYAHHDPFAMEFAYSDVRRSRFLAALMDQAKAQRGG
jgi:hypothetical protein